MLYYIIFIYISCGSMDTWYIMIYEYIHYVTRILQRLEAFGWIGRILGWEKGSWEPTAAWYRSVCMYVCMYFVCVCVRVRVTCVHVCAFDVECDDTWFCLPSYIEREREIHMYTNTNTNTNSYTQMYIEIFSSLHTHTHRERERERETHNRTLEIAMMECVHTCINTVSDVWHTQQATGSSHVQSVLCYAQKRPNCMHKRDLYYRTLLQNFRPSELHITWVHLN